MRQKFLTARQMIKALIGTGLIGWQVTHASPLPVPVTYPQDMQCDSAAFRPDRGAPLQEQVLKTGTGAIGYYRFGHGSPIVLITGYRSSMAEWNAYFLGELAKSHEVVVFDNRGVGRSQANGAPYDIEALAQDTNALIKALHLKHATVLGWSMGGMIAQQLAIDAPASVDRLVLMSSAPPGPKSVPTSADLMRVLSGSGNDHFQRVMAILFPAPEQQQAIRCFVEDMFNPTGYGQTPISSAVTGAQDKILRSWQQDQQALGSLHHLGKLPVLVLTGSDDIVLSPQNARVLWRSLPKATLVEVASGGHAMMYQYPRALADRIDAFIAHATR